MYKYPKFVQLTNTPQYTLYTKTSEGSLDIRINIKKQLNIIIVYEAQINSIILTQFKIKMGNIYYTFGNFNSYLKNKNNYRIDYDMKNQDDGNNDNGKIIKNCMQNITMVAQGEKLGLIIFGRDKKQCMTVSLKRKYIVSNGVVICNDSDQSNKLLQPQNNSNRNYNKLINFNKNIDKQVNTNKNKMQIKIPQPQQSSSITTIPISPLPSPSLSLQPLLKSLPQQTLQQSFRIQIKGIRRLIQLQKQQYCQKIQKIQQKHTKQLQDVQNKYRKRFSQIQNKIQNKIQNGMNGIRTKYRNNKYCNHQQSYWNQNFSAFYILFLIIFCGLIYNYVQNKIQPFTNLHNFNNSLINNTNNSSVYQNIPPSVDFYDKLLTVINWTIIDQRLTQIQQDLQRIHYSQRYQKDYNQNTDKLLKSNQTQTFLQILQKISNKLSLQNYIRQDKKQQLTKQQTQYTLNKLLLKIQQLQYQIHKLKQVNLVYSTHAIDFIDTNSLYFDEFAINNNTIVGIHDNKFSYLFGKNKLSINRRNIYTINMTKGTAGLGISDYQLINKKNFLSKQNINVILYFQNGQCYDSQKWNVVQGDMFKQGEQVKVLVDREIGRIQWRVKGQLRHFVDSQKIKDENIQWVPFLWLDSGNVINLVK